jgi:hypothetical protein
VWESEPEHQQPCFTSFDRFGFDSIANPPTLAVPCGKQMSVSKQSGQNVGNEPAF